MGNKCTREQITSNGWEINPRQISYIWVFFSLTQLRYLSSSACIFSVELAALGNLAIKKTLQIKKYLHCKTGWWFDCGMKSLWMNKISYLPQHPWKIIVPPLPFMAQAWWGTSNMLRFLSWVFYPGFFLTCLYIVTDTRNRTRTGAERKFCIVSPEYWHSLAFFSSFPGFHKRQHTSWLWRSYKLLEIARSKQMGTKPHNMSTGKLQTTVWRIQKA